MCGICGILALDRKKEIDCQQLEGMVRSLYPRGPDDEGIFVKESFGFGSRRLSIIDIKGGHQPLFNEDKSLGIVFNGEIYNFLELKKTLLKKGHRFSTRSDTEVILHLYEDLGEKCLLKLEGMFALAIFDFRKKELFLARDPIGKKPLYWSVFGDKFVFASEPKAILTLPDFKKIIDKDSLPKYFFYGYVPSPNTIFRTIKRLSSGCFMYVRKSVVEEEKKYWEIDYSEKFNDLNTKEIKDRTISLLAKAVEKRLIADVPIGIFLSGGLDSSLVAAFIPSKKVEAFTIGFEDSSFDESIYAKKAADYLGIKQNIEVFSDSEVLGILPKALELMDEPLADPSVLPTYLLSVFTRRKVKVALSGDGGDENFAGYPKYLAHYLLEKTPLKKFPFRRPPEQPSGKFWTFEAYAGFPLELRNQFWLSSFSVEEIEKLTGTKLDLSDIYKYHQAFNGKDLVDEAFFLDQKMTLADQNLVKVDRVSMANSLEVRCPFLDKDIVEFAAKIPFKSKIGRFKTKSLLREIAKELLPPEIINLPKKGFGIPLREWLSNELTPLINENLSLKKIREEDILNPEMVEKILKKRNYEAVWKLLVFEIWLKKWG